MSMTLSLLAVARSTDPGAALRCAAPRAPKAGERVSAAIDTGENSTQTRDAAKVF